MNTKKPEQIFTPRNSEVNETMYISRPGLEEDIVDAIEGSNHVLIHGESGTGKSWIYKHVLKKEGISYISANLANASRLEGLDAELKNIIDRECNPKKTEYQEQKRADIKAIVASGGISHKRIYELGQKEPLEACLELLRSKSKSGVSCLIFDNFEQILDQPKIIKDIGNCIILLDDERYASYNVKIILVGVPNDLDVYFSNQNNVATIINRITEVPEISKLSLTESKQFINKGFENQLGYYCEDYSELAKQISFVTKRIPQQLHELCLSIAREVEKDKQKTITQSIVVLGANKWFKQSLSGSFAVIDSLLEFGERTDKSTRLLYVIGRYQGNEIDPEEIIGVFEQYFPKYSNIVKKQNKAQKFYEVFDAAKILHEISEKKISIIRLSPNKKTYRFIRPQYQMSLRIMLELDEYENVRKVDYNELMKQINIRNA